MDTSGRNIEKTGSREPEPDLTTVSTTFNEGVGAVVSYQSDLIAKNREAIALAKSQLRAIRTTLKNSDQTD